MSFKIGGKKKRVLIMIFFFLLEHNWGFNFIGLIAEHSNTCCSMHIGAEVRGRKCITPAWRLHGLILWGAEHWQLAGARTYWSEMEEYVSTLNQQQFHSFLLCMSKPSSWSHPTPWPPLNFVAGHNLFSLISATSSPCPLDTRPMVLALDLATGANGNFAGNSSGTRASLENFAVSFNNGRIRPQG